MKRSDVFFTGLLLPLDYAALLTSFLGAYYLRQQFPTLIPPFILGNLADTLSYTAEVALLPYWEYIPFIMGFCLLALVIFVLSGLYRLQRFATFAQSSVSVLRSVSLAFLALLIITFIYGSVVLPRLIIVYSFIFAGVGLFVVRGLVSYLRLLLQKTGFGVRRVAILGEGSNAERARLYVGRNRRRGYLLRRTYPRHELSTLLRAIDRRAIDELIVADHLVREEELIELREHCIERRVGFLFVPSVLEMLTSQVVIRDMQGYPIIEVPVTPLEGWGYLVKRVADWGLATLFLLVFSPLYLLLAIWLWLDDPGPILFRHQRLGRDLRPFWLYKFRTMKQEYCDGQGDNVGAARRRFQELLRADSSLAAEWQANHKLKDDLRVTRVGRWLRRTSLDELPQIFNVWRGELSLVGPRPIVKQELTKYGRLQHRLSTIKPGVTGLWQVSGRNDTTYEERIRLDMLYIETWSVWLDIIILFRTGAVLLSPRGAY